MSVYKIMLRNDEVKDFVSRANRCDFDIDVSYNHLTVDAKSILGVFAMDLKQILTVTCNGFNADFDRYLTSKFAAAC